MRPLLRTFVALLLLLGVACSSDAKQSADKKPTTTTSTTTTTIKALKGEEVDTKASPYCADWGRIRSLGGPALTGDPAKDGPIRKAFYAKVVPLAEQLVADADGSIKPAAQFALDQAKALAQSGSSAPQTPKAAARQQELAKYALDHCAKQ